MTLTLARGGAKSDRHTTRHADQVEPPQAVMVGPTQAVRTTLVYAMVVYDFLTWLQETLAGEMLRSLDSGGQG